MGSNLTNVPVKGHFTISEIAVRWEVDESVVEYCILEKGLRLAAYTRDLGITGLLVNPVIKDSMAIVAELAKFVIKTHEEIQLNKAGGSLFGYKLENTEIEFSQQNVLTPNFSLGDREYPKYLYLAPESGLPIICTAKLFNGQLVFF